MDESNLRKPSVWGPHFWKMYDIIANTYPKRPNGKERRAMLKFLESQKYLIPCSSCASNYKAIIKRHPPNVESRESLQKWFELLKRKVQEHVDKGGAKARSTPLKPHSK